MKKFIPIIIVLAIAAVVIVGLVYASAWSRPSALLLSPSPAISSSPLAVSPAPKQIAAAVPTPAKSYRVVAAGDIAQAGGAQAKTAQLVRALNPDKVLVLGDTVYDRGTINEFMTYYEPTWGAFKAKTAPAPGNHEYLTSDAAGYFEYFGKAAGNKDKGYYSFDLGSWHLISLNSEKMSSGQLDWLKQDLDSSQKPCILAYWHRPLFSSGEHGNDPTFKPFWDLLYAKGADIVLNGHDHNYERFEKQDPSGRSDSRGIREFVVGTGGATERYFIVNRANSQIRKTGVYGVLELTLRDNSYETDFRPVSGTAFSDRVAADACNP